MTTQLSTQINAMATRLDIDPNEMQSIIKNTVMPNANVSNEQFVSFVAVANEYKLNPLTKEVYAFPAKGGGIQPIVSIDGWLKIINTQPEFNGMTHEDIRENGELVAIKCNVYKKGIEHPITVTEYMSECKGSSQPWQKWPARMLRHKATIQAARYAFGLSGIIDQDEAERFEQSGVIKDVTPKELPPYSDEDFNENFEKWASFVQQGRQSPENIIAMVSTKYTLSQEQQDQIMALSQVIEGELINEDA